MNRGRLYLVPPAFPFRKRGTLPLFNTLNGGGILAAGEGELVSRFGGNDREAGMTDDRDDNEWWWI